MTTGTERAIGTARDDWEERISLRSDERDAAAVPDLPSPGGLHATPGRGHVTLRWDPVPGAVGYLVHRAPADSPRAELEPVDHLGGDVLAVPDTWYVDTTGEPGTPYDYAVASVPTVTECGVVGDPITVASLTGDGPEPEVSVSVDTRAEGEPLPRPWQPMIGSERLSQLLCTDLSGGREIGLELRAALQRVHDEVGVDTVRAHAILHDDLGIYREVDGQPVHDFDTVDRVYDTHPRDRAAPVRRARLHAARPGQRPGPEGLRVRRHHLAARRTTTAGRT